MDQARTITAVFSETLIASINGVVSYAGSRTGAIYVTAMRAAFPPTNGLVAYYPFNGNANDESGNGNTGVVYGATLIADRFGQANSAYAFDGNDYIETPNLGLTTDLGVTLAGWARLNDMTAHQGFIGALADADSYPPGTDPWNRHYIGVRDGNYWTGAGNTQKYIVNTAGIGEGDWFFFTVTLDGSNAVYYVNGVEVDSTGYEPRGVCGIGTYIGAINDRGAAAAFLDGAIDDVSVYDRVLSSEEILGLSGTYETQIAAPGSYSITNVPIPAEYVVSAFMDSNGNGVRDVLEARGSHSNNPVAVSNDAAGVDVVLEDPIPFEEGLVLYYTFDEDEGAVVTDRSGNGNDGSPQSGATYVSNGLFGGAFEFVGASSCRIQAPDDPSLRPTNVTVSVWLCSSADVVHSKHATIFSKEQSVAAGYRLDAGAGAVRFKVMKGGAPVTGYHLTTLGVDFVPGRWYHLASTYDGITRKLFLDGELVEYADGPSYMSHSGAPITVGPLWKGKMDEVRIYDRALTDDAVAELYSTYEPASQPDAPPPIWVHPDVNDELPPPMPDEDGLILHYGFDADTGDTVVDKSLSGYDGTSTNLSWSGDGIAGGCVDFPGAYGSVNAGNIPLRDTNSVTLAAWVDMGDGLGSGYEDIFYIIADFASSQGMLLFYETGKFCFQFHNTDGRWDVVKFSNAGLTGWHHLAGVLDQDTGRQHIYLDGELKGSFTYVGAPKIDSPAPFMIGGGPFQAGSHYGWDGKLDDVRIYNRALISSDVAELYQTTGSYWLDTEASAGGVVDVGDGWYTNGSPVTITATADQYYAFEGWSGDVNPLQTNDNPLVVVMDQTRSVLANFSAMMAPSNVPHWWLAQHGLTNDFDAAVFGDQDSDGIPTWREYQNGMNPTSADSDADGFSDTLELRKGTKPDDAASFPTVRSDFDNDGHSDVGCYDAAGIPGIVAPGTWHFRDTGGAVRIDEFGYDGTVPVAGDFDGDGIADYGCYDASGIPGVVAPGAWYFMTSSNGFLAASFGYHGTVPVAGDFDRDGTDDYGCYDASGIPGVVAPGAWYFMTSSNGFLTASFGYDGTVPVGGTHTE